MSPMRRLRGCPSWRSKHGCGRRETRLGEGKHRRSMAAEQKGSTCTRFGPTNCTEELSRGGGEVYNHTITHGNAAFKSTGVVEPMYHIRRRARHITANMRRNVTTSDGTPLLIPFWLSAVSLT
ncbi:hypothetical protein LZ31DRAFT_322199 [Colletotrichum somersetense]|nr:hypothetical protein LZ31DRAFT_322199 [Colletotrichum somersetense]